MKPLNVGIFAHIDAGKTSLTERLLLASGVLRKAGSVDGGTSMTDFLPMERRRGISVRDATVTFTHGETTVNLIDTPGHADFFEETELALSAIDLCVLVISAREGVEAQTELLLDAIKRKNLPAVIFLNKCDMDGIQAESVAQDLKQRISGEILPFNAPPELHYAQPVDFTENAVSALDNEPLLEAFFENTLTEQTLQDELKTACSQAKIIPLIYGSAKTGDGVDLLLDILCSFYEFPNDPNAAFSAFVYQIEHRKNAGKIAHVRVFQGKISVREEIFNRRTGSSLKAAQIKRIHGEKYIDGNELKSGETGAITGLSDVRAGDFLGTEPQVHPIQLSFPYLRIKVTPTNPDELIKLKSALEELTDESPSLALEWISEKRELNIAASGKVQTEILRETLYERYGIRADMSTPSVIYRETPLRPAFGYEHYTMPKPCWAVVKFYIEPLPLGSGFVYESTVSEKKIAYRYQEHIKTEVPRTLSQGLKGWQVTDLKVTLIDGENHPQHTHPLDFFVATPMGIMDGLRNCGTTLLEPVLSLRICAPETAMGKILNEITTRRAKIDPPTCGNGLFTLCAEIPAAETFDLSERISSLSGGRCTYQTRFLGYFPCPDATGKSRERVGIDPLNRAQWILHARGAYKV